MLAYKALFYKDGKVVSSYGNTAWSNGALQAECKKHLYDYLSLNPTLNQIFEPEKEQGDPKHSPPGKNCLCGIHGVRFRHDLNRWISNDNKDNPETKRNAVILVIELTGRIVEHDLGYRAEMARPVAVLDYLYNLPPLMQETDAALIYSGYAAKAARALDIPVHDFLAYPEELPPPKNTKEE